MRTARRAGLRGAAAIGLAAALALGGSAGAFADTEPTADPSPTGDGYPPDPVLDVEVLEPICDGDVPYLQYAVDVTDPDEPPTDVTVTFLNPGGEDYVLTGLPLSGRVLWPGAEVDAEGNPLDWPGWSLVDGEWVVGDEWDWVRPSVQVLFEVNPELTRSVDYPPSSPDCDTDPPGGEPTIEVDTLTPLCVAGVTYLDYAVTVTGTPDDSVTLTWHNPDGEDFVHGDQTLQGRVLWPGAYPERFVELSADDGWELVNNMWQNTRDYGWAVGTVDVTFSVNPEVTVPVTYPDDTENCLEEDAPPPPGDASSPPPAGEASSPVPFLPNTGAEVLGLVALAAALLAAGAVIVVVVRRRRPAPGGTDSD